MNIAINRLAIHDIIAAYTMWTANRKHRYASYSISSALILLAAVAAVLPIPYTPNTIPVTDGKAELPPSETFSSSHALDGQWYLLMNGKEPAILQEVPAVAWSTGYATYRLELSVPEDLAGTPLELFTHTMGTSGELIVNGLMIGEQGRYGERAEDAVATARSPVYQFSLKEGVNHIDIRVSNFTDLRAGLWEQVMIAPAPLLSTRYERRIDLDHLIFAAVLFIAAITFILSLLMKEYHLLYFVSAILFAAFGGFMMISYALYEWIPDIDYTVMKKASFTLYYFSGGLIIKSIATDIFRHRRTPLIDRIAILFLLMGIVNIVLPFRASSYISYIYHPLIALVFGYLIIQQYLRTFSPLHANNLTQGILRLAIQLLLFFSTAHDSFSYVSGNFSYEILHITSLVYAASYWLLLTQSILKERERIETAKNRMLTIADHTRDQIRNDLHDRLAQLTSAMRFLTEGYVKIGKAEEQDLALLHDTAVQISDELRNIMNGIGPARLEGTSFESAVRDMAQQNERVYSVPFVLDMGDLPDTRWNHGREQLYLVMREGITNAMIHAKPSYIHITLHRDEGVYTLKIENDGIDETLSEIHTIIDHGLDIMRYRIESLGGTFSAGPVPPEVFRVTAEIPERSV